MGNVTMVVDTDVGSFSHRGIITTGIGIAKSAAVQVDEGFLNLGLVDVLNSCPCNGDIIFAISFFLRIGVVSITTTEELTDEDGVGLRGCLFFTGARGLFTLGRGADKSIISSVDAVVFFCHPCRNLG